MITTELAGVVAEHIAAVNALDTDAIVATFAEDAYVNDARRDVAGIEAIRRWVELLQRPRRQDRQPRRHLQPARRLLTRRRLR